MEKKLHFMTPCKLQRDKEEYSLIMLSNPIEDALLDKSCGYFKRVWFQNCQHIKTEKTTQHTYVLNFYPPKYCFRILISYLEL